MTTISETQRAAILALCDTVVPRIEHAPDPDGLWARSASDLGVQFGVENALLSMSGDIRAGALHLMDSLAESGFDSASQESREQTLTSLAADPQTRSGISGLVKLVPMLAYGLAEPSTGQNPNWKTLRYPGPLSPPPAAPKTIQPVVPHGESFELEADVVIVGSGAGGGVIAGELSKRGLRVVVTEAGQYRNEGDFDMLEIPAYWQMYWRGGPQTSADQNFTLLAGATLGGGTVINWANCIRLTKRVRDEWAAAGLTDVATDFDRHLDAVAERISITADASDLNPFFERIGAATERLGWHTQIAERNIDTGKYDPASGAYIGFGDQTGAKQSTLNTYLQDAYDNGAAILVGTTIREVLTKDGRAAGVTGVYTDAAGATTPVTVHAQQVVVAAGALESPALLLRSGIGGPAVGQHLRLHPTTGAMAVYDEEVRAFWGPPHSLLVDEFERTREHGFRFEGTQYGPALYASALPFSTAADHKRLVEKLGTGGVYLIRIRDHGAGQVALDANGQAQVTYSVTDPVDIGSLATGLDKLLRLLAQSGAVEIQPLAGMPPWRRGDDLDPYIERLQRLPLGPGGLGLLSAHQMGSCRMGSDPTTSVADPSGQLHDTPGVWIGDASAFPTASGVNPMLPIMALARRTAEAIAEATVASAAHTG